VAQGYEAGGYRKVMKSRNVPWEVVIGVSKQQLEKVSLPLAKVA
jgi:hypothetical protein